MKLLKILVGIVVLLVLALFVAGLFADRLAKTGIQEGGKYALGVDTRVEDVDIGFFDGTFAMQGFAVSNPKGYGDGSFLEMGTASASLSASSLLSDTIRIPSVDLSGIRVQLVQSLKGSNYGQILDHLEKFQGGSDDAKGGGTRLVIDKLTMKDIRVVVRAVPELDLAAVEVPIDRIELTGIGEANGEGVLVADLVGIVVEAILGRASTSGRLPALVQGSLSGDLGQLQGLQDAGVKALEGFLPGASGGDAGGVIDALGRGLKGLGSGR